MRRPYPLLVALVVPLVFVHAEYQPSASIGDATVYVSDLAVLAIALLGLAAGRELGFAPLRASRSVWIAAAAFLALVAVGTLLGPALTDDYPFADNALTAAKLAEYALLAPAAALVFRRAADLRPLLLSITLWSTLATLVGLLQFLGFVDEFEGRRPGQREPSFLGIHDFAALSGMALAIGLAGLALRARPARLEVAALVAGGLGVVLSGATAAVAGIAAAGVAAWLLGRRRAIAVALVVALVAAGVAAMRTVDMRPVLDALGIEQPREVATDPEASWQQRFALGYIGGRIFVDHPLTGVGWQASEQRYEPYLDDARARFPDLPERALPSPEHEWGVQNGYVQAAADLGILGLAAFLALFLVPLRAAWHTGRAAAVPILWLLVAMGVWIGIGLVAGIPLVGLTWLGVGLAAAAAAWRE